MKHQLFKDISKNTISKVIEIDNLNDLNLGKIERGIIAIHAKWSGQSVMIGNSILRLFDDYDLGDFSIIIVDASAINKKEQNELIGTKCNGYFESIWIENNKIEFVYIDNNSYSEITTFKKFLVQKAIKK